MSKVGDKVVIYVDYCGLVSAMTSSYGDEIYLNEMEEKNRR